ncbi:hypothetical protein D3C71_2205690 [compost metagenome]
MAMADGHVQAVEFVFDGLAQATAAQFFVHVAILFDAVSRDNVSSFDPLTLWLPQNLSAQKQPNISGMVD